MTYLVFLLLSLIAPSRTPAAVHRQLPLLHLSMKDGLSNDYVFHIVNDSRGYMWVATGYGLNRYDGDSFTMFLSNSGTGPAANNDITSLRRDIGTDDVWMSHNWHGVSLYSDSLGKFKRYDSRTGGLSSDEVYTLLLTATGDLYAFTKAGIDKFDREQDRFFPVAGYMALKLPSGRVASVAGLPNGDIYIGYNDYGLWSWNPSSGVTRRYDSRPKSDTTSVSFRINSMHPDEKGYLWLATSEGISVFDPARGQYRVHCPVAGGPEGSINAILRDSSGRVWAGGRSRLYYFNSADIEEVAAGEVEIASMFIKDDQRGVANPTINAVAEDLFGNIWVGSNGGGVSMLDLLPKYFSNWQLKTIPNVTNGLDDKEVMTVFQDPQGDLWMGTDGGGILRNRGGENLESYSSRNGRAHSWAYNCGLADTQGNIWFNAFENGLEKYSTESGSFRHIPIPGPTEYGYCLTEDHDHNIWIGREHGIRIYNPDTGIFDSPTDPVFNRMSVRSILQDKKGMFWIGTRGNGILTGSGKTGLFTCFPDDRMSHFTINQFLEDSKGRIWAATDEGLALLHGGEEGNPVLSGVNDGLACGRICSLVEDEEGKIWLGTNFGLTRFDPEKNQFENYALEDGVLPGPYMPGSVCRASDGTIYFGGLNGVCYFRPDSEKTPSVLPSVVFTGVKALGEGLSSTDVSVPIKDGKVSLSPDHSVFSVQFNIMNKALQPEVEYAYRMEGLGKDWVNLGNTDNITFRNLPYGNYRLQIRTRLRHGEWSEEVSSLSITVNPPLYLSLWAKLIYVIAGIALIFLLIRNYHRHIKLKTSLDFERLKNQKQEELNEERLQFYSNMAHELRTPMTLILAPVEDLVNADSLMPEQREKIGMIHNNARRLMNMVSRILEFRKTETHNRRLKVTYGSLEEFLKSMVERYSPLINGKGLEFKTDVELEDRKVYYDQEVLSMIVDNLISNAVKYTTAGSVALNARIVTDNEIDYLEIEIEDTGCGIPEKDLERIFERYFRSESKESTSGFGIGLALVKNLVGLHEGTLNVWSEEGSGSRFTLRLIAGNTYPEAEHLSVKDEIPSSADRREKVLVIEDEAEIRNYLKGELSKHYDVIEASDGDEGFRNVLKELPDIVITDVAMPGRNGIELCRAIKKHPATRHIPVILLTAKDSSADKIAGYDSGADGYITKPFSMAVLRSQVANILQARRIIVKTVAESPVVRHDIFTTSLDRLDREVVEQLTGIIHRNLGEEKIDVTAVATEMKMSYSTLYRKVKTLTGLTPIEFIRKIRLQEAERLLLTGKYSISEITVKVGFSSYSYFRECFKKEFDKSPTDYIKDVRDGDYPDR